MLQNRNAWISYHFLEYFISQIFWAFKTVTAVPLKNVQENIQYSSIIKEHNVLIGFQVEVPHRYYRCQWILPDFVIAIVVTKSGKLGLHACVCVCVCACCMCVCALMAVMISVTAWSRCHCGRRMIPGVLPCCLAGSLILSTAASVLTTADPQTTHGRTRLYRAQFGKLQIWFLRYLIPVRIAVSIAFNLFFGKYIDLLIT